MSEANCILGHAKPTLAATGFLCEHHAERISSQLADVVTWWALLPALIVPGSGEGDGNCRGRAIDSPSPVRLDIVAIGDMRTGIALAPGDIVGVRCVLHQWARAVAEDNGLSMDLLGTVAQDVGVLRTWSWWIAEQPWVDEFAGELRAAWRELRAAVGVRPPTLIGHCPITGEQGECGGALHQDRWGGMGVSCARCGAHWGDADLRRLGLVVGSPVWASAEQAAEFHGVDQRTIRRWAESGRIRRDARGHYDIASGA